MLARLSTISISLLLSVALVLSVFVSEAVAQPTPTINYQGKLTSSTGVAVDNGTYNMRFWLLQSTGQATGDAIWTESLTGTNQVQVTNGLFSVMLGSTSPLTSVDFNQTLYLGVEIGGTGSPVWDGEMLPRKPLGTVPAAFEAFRVGGVASSSFLRSDQADTASSLLTFTGGLLSTASSTITDLTFGTATGTTFVIGGEALTSFTGAGLINDGGTLTVASSSLNLTVAGLSDTSFSSLTSGDLFSYNGTDWVNVATSTLNIALSDTTGTLTATRGGTGLTSVTQNQLLIGGAGNTWTQVATSTLNIALANTTGTLPVNRGGTGATSFPAGQILFGNGADALNTSTDLFFDNTNGRLGLGTSTPYARLSLQRTGFSGAGVVGLDQYLQTTNSVASVAQFGNRFFLDAANTATTTIVGSLFQIKDDTAFGNVVRGLEVQADFGINSSGENTALSGFAHTFGVRGFTTGDAGEFFEPAGGYFETGGDTQGNAIRGYSETITTATLLSLFQASSSFSGTGLQMNFGNTSGTFTGNFLDLRKANTSYFIIDSEGGMSAAGEATVGSLNVTGAATTHLSASPVPSVTATTVPVPTASSCRPPVAVPSGSLPLPSALLPPVAPTTLSPSPERTTSPSVVNKSPRAPWTSQAPTSPAPSP
jgi:hypothetical protein